MLSPHTVTSQFIYFGLVVPIESVKYGNILNRTAQTHSARRSSRSR